MRDTKRLPVPAEVRRTHTPFGDHSGLSEAFDKPPAPGLGTSSESGRGASATMRATSFIGTSRGASSGCTSGRGTGRPSTATRSPTAIVLLEQVGANRAQAATHQLRKPAPLLAGERSGRLSRSQRLRLSTGRPPLGGELPGAGMGPRQTRAGTLVRAAGVQAVSPAQRGRSGSTRLAAASTRARCGSDEDYQPSVLPTDSAKDPESLQRVGFPVPAARTGCCTVTARGGRPPLLLPASGVRPRSGRGRRS